MYKIYKAEESDNAEEVVLEEVGELETEEKAEQFVEAHIVQPLYKGYSDETDGDHGSMYEVQTGEVNLYLCHKGDEQNLKDWIAYNCR